MTNTIVPNVNAVTIRTRCTQKNEVGACHFTASAHARSSSTIALKNRGQMTMLNTPAAIKSQAANFPITHAFSQPKGIDQ